MTVRLPTDCYTLRLWSDGEIEVVLSPLFKDWVRECLDGPYRLVAYPDTGVILSCEDEADAMMAMMAWGSLAPTTANRGAVSAN